MAKYLDLTGVTYLWSCIKTWVGNYVSLSNGTISIGSNSITPITSHQDISGKQDVIDSSHKLSADLISDGTTNKAYTATEQTKLSGIESGAEVNVIEGVSLNGTATSPNNKVVNIPLAGYDNGSGDGLMSEETWNVLNSFFDNGVESFSLPVGIVSDFNESSLEFFGTKLSGTVSICSAADAPNDPGINGIIAVTNDGEKVVVYTGNDIKIGVWNNGDSLYDWTSIDLLSINSKLSGVALGAEVNQNAFSNVKVGSSTIAADTKTDTLELAAASNSVVSLTPDTTNDKVTIDVDKDLSKYDNSTSGFLTSFTETDPTVPSWAKASSKPTYTASEVGAVATTAVGAASGVCPLNSSTKIDTAYLPSYVDDVIEVYARTGQAALSANWFSTTSSSGSAITGESGKIYVLMADSGDYAANTQFRWATTAYVKLNDGGVSAITTGEIDVIVAT